VTSGDEAVERTTDKLGRASARAAERGGLAGKLAGPLGEDAEFLRKLKPSLVKERLRGGQAPEPPPEPSLPRVAAGRRTEPNPFVLVAAAFVAGVLLAKLIDWRSHAHPRD
jgi:hypothetical protein